jgi:hypothetical protein
MLSAEVGDKTGTSCPRAYICVCLCTFLHEIANTLAKVLVRSYITLLLIITYISIRIRIIILYCYFYYYNNLYRRARGHEYPDNHHGKQHTQHASNDKPSTTATHHASHYYPPKACNTSPYTAATY